MTTEQTWITIVCAGYVDRNETVIKCGKDLGRIDGKGSSGISHSMCLYCYEKCLQEAESFMGKKLNGV